MRAPSTNPIETEGAVPAPPPAAAASVGAAPAGTSPPRAGLLVRAWNLAGRLARANRDNLRRSGAARLHATALDRPERLLVPARAARRLLPSRLFLAQAEAIVTARARGWKAAAPLFRRIAESEGRRALTGPAAEAILRPDAEADTPLTLAIPARDRPVALPPALAEGIVVYTAVFGRRRALAPVFGIADRVRFLCFTDQEIAAAGWEILPPALPVADPVEAAAWHKINPEAVLARDAPGARASLYLDPDRALIGNADTLLTRWLLHQDLAMWRHAGRDWRDMAERHLVTGSAPAAALLAQAERLEAEGVRGQGSGYDTGMVWRRHGTPEATALGEAWGRAWSEAPGADDLTLYRALNGRRGAGPAPVRPAVLPARLGSATDNVYVTRMSRRPVRPRGAGKARPAGQALPIVFLSAAAHARSASTFLRGRQLSAMVAAANPDRYAVRFTEAAEEVQGAVVILTKGALATLSPEEIAALDRRNIATVGCWDDIRPDPVKAGIVDAHMTLSHCQTRDLNRIFPETPAFLVTHHVNSQVPVVTPPADRLRTGYFGDLENTARPESIADMVELVGIDTREVNDNWLAALPRFNCHWIIRRARPWDGWKPFLKGFVAARCGAVAIVTANDGDAAYYLGDDYPFYAQSIRPADLEMAMATVASGFGGPEWRLAQEIMAGVAARSTDAQVCMEFRAMIDEVAA